MGSINLCIQDKIKLLSQILLERLMKNPAVYIMANKIHGVLYTGVTSNLTRRVYEHKQSQQKGFTKKYNCKLLVYYELIENMEIAIAREKQIKGGSRKNKIKLIEAHNPAWLDLYQDICN